MCVVVQRSADETKLVFRALNPFKGLGSIIASYPIAPTGLYNSSLSSDGTRVAIAKMGNPEIDILLLATGRVEHVTATTRHDQRSLAWAPGDKGFFVGAGTSTGTALLDIDLTGNAHVLWDQPGAIWTWGIPSPDGRHLGIMNWRIDSNIWTIEGF